MQTPDFRCFGGVAFLHTVAKNSIPNIATFILKPGILILNPGTSNLIALNMPCSFSTCPYG